MKPRLDKILDDIQKAPRVDQLSKDVAKDSAKRVFNEGMLEVFDRIEDNPILHSGEIQRIKKELGL